MNWIKEKVALVTGGASGIGAGIVKEAVSQGARVVIADINEQKANETILACKGFDGEVSFYQIDVTDSEAIPGLMAHAQAKGELKYLANSAGLQTYGTAETTTEESWDKTIDINMKSMFLVCRQVIPILRKNGGGSIVNISSIIGLVAQRNALAYATAKGGVISMTRSMGIDHAAEGIYVNGILPGSIDTPMLRYGASEHGEEEQVLKEWASRHPIGRIGTPEEIAKFVMFLWSPESNFMVGQSIEVDGGLGSSIF